MSAPLRRASSSLEEVRPERTRGFVSDFRMVLELCDVLEKRTQGATARSADRSVVSDQRPISGVGYCTLSAPSPSLPSHDESAGAEREGPAPAPTKALLRSSHWSGRPMNHWIQRGWRLYPGGRVVLAFPQTPARSRARLYRTPASRGSDRRCLARSPSLACRVQEGGLIVKGSSIVNLSSFPDRLNRSHTLS